jgi:hypothetical protein
MATEQTLICWHDDRPAWRHNCPVPVADGEYIMWGRCRSGRRWFWSASTPMSDPVRCSYGWADTETAAIEAGRAAVVEVAAGKPATASLRHGEASYRLKQINAEKRRARPSNGGTDAGVVEYLYGTWWNSEDQVHHVVQFRITKKTAKRIYYLRDWPADGEIGFISRQDLETNGEARNRGRRWHESDSTLYAAPPDLSRTPAKPSPAEEKAELSRLKREMADAHPDRGGTSAGFIAARKRYKQALTRVHAHQTGATAA